MKSRHLKVVWRVALAMLGLCSISLIATKPALANTGLAYIGPGMPYTQQTFLGTKCVQQALGITIDGQFGQQTYDAVRAFQQVRGLSVDGIVGPMTGDQLIGLTADPFQCGQYVPTSYMLMDDNGNIDTGGQVVNPDTVKAPVLDPGAAVPVGGSVTDCLLEGVKSSLTVGGIAKVIWKHKFDLDPIVAAGDAVGCILLGT